MIDVTPHRQALGERIRVVELIINETHVGPTGGPVSREARGMAVVLLFAAYEELLKSLTRTLLETVIRLKISNRRLQPGLRAFALSNAAKSLRNVGDKKVFVSAIPQIIELTGRTDRKPTVDPNDFPDDGSFMKQSQIKVWSSTFDIGPPAKILKNIWNQIDAVVSQRNQIAHGSSTPQQIGRTYTEAEILDLITNWHTDWDAFLVHVQNRATTRDFFRTAR